MVFRSTMPENAQTPCWALRDSGWTGGHKWMFRNLDPAWNIACHEA